MSKVKYARRLRQNPTPAEAVLWRRLKGKALGVKFRRQHPIMGWIADFYCPKARLVIEVDGPSHSSDEAQVDDAYRDWVMETKGIVVFRITNEQVLEATDRTIETIRSIASALLQGWMPGEARIGPCS